MNFSLQSNRGATGVLGRAKGGLEAFDFPGQVEQRFGAVWIGADRRGNTYHPRHGWQFSGLVIACLGWARQCSAGRGNNATRGDTVGQFSRGKARQVKARRALAGPGEARLHATQSGIWDNFPRHGQARSGEAMIGMATTPPGAVIPDIFPSTKKHPHNAGQRSKG